MPVWLSPEQVRVLPISDKTSEYARDVLNRLSQAGIRCSCDLSGEKIGAKIAKAHADKLPCMLVVGPQEVESASVNVRIRGQKTSQAMGMEEFLQRVNQAIDRKDVNLAWDG